jgi:hypothetical protein
MPVSGMAYLDRPNEAGYFIFPDLSVRHEGKYKLSFNLYEATKDEKDMDPEDSPMTGQQQPPVVEGEPDKGSFDWRMKVESAHFTVFSAKKFPGLSESTTLSRTVAEQGCRVRIRRDVRMRRRDGKGTNDGYDEYDEQYSRVRSSSPHESYSRPRSLSNASVDRQPYVPAPERRLSGADYAPQSYPSNYAPPPVTPQSATSGYNHLSFGSSAQSNQASAQFAQPQPPAPPAQPHHYQPPAQSAPFSHPPQYRQPAGAYGYHERQPYVNQYPEQRSNYEQDYRRTSVGYPSAPPPQATSNQYPPVDQYSRTVQAPSYQQQQYPPRPRSPVQATALAPLKMIEPKHDNMISPGAGPLSAVNRFAPALPSPSYQDRPSALHPYPTSEPTRTGKRSYDSVFNPSSHNQPLYNGQRPTSSHHTQASSSTFDDDDDEVSMEALRMQYKRADGTNHCRDLPTLE